MLACAGKIAEIDRQMQDMYQRIKAAEAAPDAAPAETIKINNRDDHHGKTTKIRRHADGKEPCRPPFAGESQARSKYTFLPP